MDTAWTASRTWNRRSGTLAAHLRRTYDESGDPLDRALALATLTRLPEDISMESVLEQLRSPDPDEVLIAAQKAALFRDPSLFQPVLRALCERTAVSLDEVAGLLLAFGKEVCSGAHSLLKRLGPDDSRMQIVIIDLLALYRYRPAAATFSRLLWGNADEEVRAHLVKAIAMMSKARAEYIATARASRGCAV
jgi:hypothetical protein